MNITDLQQFEKLLRKALVGFAIKDDLKQFATKEDLKNSATKSDLLALEKRFENRFTTKSDLLALEKRFENRFATKADVQKAKKDVVSKLDEIEINIIATVEKHKADKDQLKNLEKRVTHIEEDLSVSTQ